MTKKERCTMKHAVTSLLFIFLAIYFIDDRNGDWSFTVSSVLSFTAAVVFVLLFVNSQSKRLNNAEVKSIIRRSFHSQ